MFLHLAKGGDRSGVAGWLIFEVEHVVGEPALPAGSEVGGGIGPKLTGIVPKMRIQGGHFPDLSSDLSWAGREKG